MPGRPLQRVLLCLCLGWCLWLLLPCSCSSICCVIGGCTRSCSGTGCGCFLSFFGVVFAAVSAVVVLVYLLLHGRLYVVVLGHWLRMLSVFISGGSCGCFCRACGCVSAVSLALSRSGAQAPTAGVSQPLFVVVFAAVAAVLVLVYLLLHGRLLVVVLGHPVQVFLCICLGWCLQLFLPCS